MPAAKFQILRKCSVCGNEFIAKTIESYYYSSACSKIAWKRRKAEEKKQQLLDEIVKTIPQDKEMITISEAFALFGVSRETIYRLIRKGILSKFNSGVRKTYVSKTELMKLYPFRENPLIKSRSVTKLYNLEPESCYTIGEIAEKYHLNDSTVYLHIRKYSIPTRQIGNFVYVPKWKSHATLPLLAKQDLPTFGYNMIDPLKSWCWGAILFYPFKISRFS